MNSDYCNFIELQSPGFFRLIVATKYSRKVMLKALKEEVKDTLKYKEILAHPTNPVGRTHGC